MQCIPERLDVIALKKIAPIPSSGSKFLVIKNENTNCPIPLWIFLRFSDQDTLLVGKRPMIHPSAAGRRCGILGG